MTLRGRRRRWGIALLLGGVLLALTGCGPQNAQNSLRPKGPAAHKIDDLFIPVVVVATIVFVLVFAGTIYAIVKFRHRAGEPDNPKQIHGNTPLEIGWTIVPALILAVIAVPTVRTIFDLDQKPKGADVLNVDVVGKQWWWEFTYPDQKIVTSTELHIPVGTPVHLNLRACEGTGDAQTCNVIHSFWVPELAGKRDVVPGRTNTLTIEADKPGTYLGQCAEFCGLSHANMRFRVIAQTGDDFDAWVSQHAAGPVTPLAGTPQRLVSDTYGCVACHFFDQTDKVNFGPNLTHLASRSTFAGGSLELTRENLVKWVMDAPSLIPMESQKCLEPAPTTCVGMPSFTKNLPKSRQPMTTADAEQIADYLLSLK